MVVGFEENAAVNSEFKVNICYDALFLRKLGKRNLFVAPSSLKNGKDLYKDIIMSKFDKDFFLRTTTALATGACSDIVKRITDIEPTISVLVISKGKSIDVGIPHDRKAEKWTWSYTKLDVHFSGRDSVELMKHIVNVAGEICSIFMPVMNILFSQQETMK